MHGLDLLVLLLELLLHLEVRLSFSLDPLLFHVSHDAGVHGLESGSVRSLGRVRMVTHGLFGGLGPVHKGHDASCAQDGA